MKPTLLLIMSGIWISFMAVNCAGQTDPGTNIRYNAIKFSPISITDSELGIGVSGEYRSGPLSFQMGADWLLAGTGTDAVSASGFRVRPEGRLYLPRPRKRRSRTEAWAEAYLGIEMTYKSVKTHFREWVYKTDSWGSNYQEYTGYYTTNKAIGPLFKGGLQFYPGTSRNLVIDMQMGIGVLYNHIQVGNEDHITSQIPTPPGTDEFSYNQYGGTRPYFNLDIRFGYRFR